MKKLILLFFIASAVTANAEIIKISNTEANYTQTINKTNVLTIDNLEKELLHINKQIVDLNNRRNEVLKLIKDMRDAGIKSKKEINNEIEILPTEEIIK